MTDLIKVALKPRKNFALFGIGLAVLLIVFIFTYSHFLNLIFSEPLLYGTKDLIFRIIIWLFLGGICLCAVKIERQPFLLWPEDSYTIDFYIISIVILLSVNYICRGIISIPFSNTNQYSFHHRVDVIDHLSKPIKFLGVITAAFCEELIFRGYLIPRLQLFFKDIRYPIIISALLFSFGHLGYQTMFYVLYTLVGGIIFGYHYQKYHNIKVLIICHFLLDYYYLILVS
jgi:membrane protease YdiL (CAAX protease family)